MGRRFAEMGSTEIPDYEILDCHLQQRWLWSSAHTVTTVYAMMHGPWSMMAKEGPWRVVALPGKKEALFFSTLLPCLSKGQQPPWMMPRHTGCKQWTKKIEGGFQPNYNKATCTCGDGHKLINWWPISAKIQWKFKIFKNLRYRTQQQMN